MSVVQLIQPYGLTMSLYKYISFSYTHYGEIKERGEITLLKSRTIQIHVINRTYTFVKHNKYINAYVCKFRSGQTFRY